MEILLAVGLIVAAWIHGYVRGKRVNSTVNMSERDLRRALRDRRKGRG